MYFLGKKKMKCCVPGCESPKNASFHRFPTDKNMIDKWIKKIGRNDVNTKTSKVCSEHFEKSVYKGFCRAEMFNIKANRFLLSTAVPTLKLDLMDFHFRLKMNLCLNCYPHHQLSSYPQQ